VADQPEAQTARHSKQDILLRLFLLAALWWVISDGATTSWLIGLPALALAAWSARRLEQPSETRLNALAMLRFVPFFVWESLRGGLDVALRTLAPQLRIDPGFIRYRTTLASPSARTLLANCVSLLPGTLAADLQDDWLEIHVLSMSTHPAAELARLEREIDRLFADSRET
jgi:multicomponent Na+:H+ antiporter subunit E